MPKMSKTSKKRQKMYNMRGCSRTKNRTAKRRQCGGSTSSPLAYTGEPLKLPHNPNLAYTGGESVAAAYPNKGPAPLPTGTPIWAPSNPQKGGCNSCGMTGGGCGCAAPLMGGSCGPVCEGVNVLSGGRKHRVGCKCKYCKRKRAGLLKGGGAYPNGLVGSALNPAEIKTWPGVGGIPGNSNYYEVNNYKNDVSRQMQAVGANPPFLNLKGGKRRTRKTNKNTNQKGGFQLLPDTLVNAARYVPYSIGSIYNAALGYNEPVNPLPWKGQLPYNGNTLMKLARI
jgi:hypothetical protein